MKRTVTIERGAKKQGDPKKVVREEKWHVLDFYAAYAPKIEAALRGMQEDVDRTVNQVDLQGQRIEAVGNVLIGMEQSAKTVAALADLVKAKTVLLPDGSHPPFINGE